MFWGLIMEPNKRYTQKVERSFHISMAALDCKLSNNESVQVMLALNDKNFLLCTLNSKTVPQIQLDLNFQTDDEIAFMHNGQGYVHLTGYLVPEDDFIEEEEDADAQDEEAESDGEEDVPQLVESKKELKRKADEQQNKKSKKQKKVTLTSLIDALAEEGSDNDESFRLDDQSSDDDDDDDDDDDEDEDEEMDDDDAEDEEDDTDEAEAEESENEDDEDESDDDEDDTKIEIEVKPIESDKKKKKNKQKNDANVSTNGTTPQKGSAKKQKGQQVSNNVELKTTPMSKKDKKNEKKNKSDTPNESNNAASVTPVKKTVEGGVHIEDLKVGSGPVAKTGKFVQVYYEGRLKSNGKQFDASKSGPGFKFRLGKREVIQGWDVGVAGMRVGGKRRITCPPNMAYGAKGSPPVIPPNSTLVFEVELKSVN